MANDARYCGHCDVLSTGLLCETCGAMMEDVQDIVGVIAVADGGTSAFTVKKDKDARDVVLTLALADIKDRTTQMVVGVHTRPELTKQCGWYAGALAHLLLARMYAQKGVQTGSEQERQLCLRMDGIVTRALRRVGPFTYDEGMVEDQRGGATEHEESGGGGDEGQE